MLSLEKIMAKVFLLLLALVNNEPVEMPAIESKFNRPIAVAIR